MDEVAFGASFDWWRVAKLPVGLLVGKNWDGPWTLGTLSCCGFCGCWRLEEGSTGEERMAVGYGAMDESDLLLLAFANLFYTVYVNDD